MSRLLNFYLWAVSLCFNLTSIKDFMNYVVGNQGVLIVKKINARVSFYRFIFLPGPLFSQLVSL